MIRAYVQLGLLPLDRHATRTLQLARHGRYEVRLIEFPGAPANTPLFWLELYDCDADAGVDACSCNDLEEGAACAAHLVDEAKRLSAVITPVIPRSSLHSGQS